MLLERPLQERLECRERKRKGEERRFRSVEEIHWSSGKVRVAGDKGLNQGERGSSPDHHCHYQRTSTCCDAGRGPGSCIAAGFPDL